MVAKRIVTSLFCSILILGVGFYYLSEKQVALINENSDTKNFLPKQQPNTTPKIEKKYDLYSNTPYDMPLLSIYEISKLSPDIKKIVDDLLENSQGFYILKKLDDKVLVLLQNPIIQSNNYSRHDLQYVEIHPNGKKIFHNAGYIGDEDEISNALEQPKDWSFDKTYEPWRPVKHIVRDEKGKIKFTENWSYDEKNPIKYQMKDAKDRAISILKEIQENDSNYRKEHLFYDNNGNVTMSISINYDGADISRFTYYNSHHTIDSISIISDFENGKKIKESVYNDAYELINTFVPEYNDDLRTKLQILDKDGNEITKLSS